MRSNRAFLVLFIAVLVCAGIFFLMLATDADAQTPQNTATLPALAQVDSQAQATATPEPSPTATPTATQPQYSLTAAAMNMTAAADQRIAAGIAATSAVDVANIQARAVEKQAEYQAITAQNEARKQELVNEGKEIEALMMFYSVERERLHLAAETADYLDGKLVADYLLAAGLIAIAISLPVTALLRNRIPEQVNDDTEETSSVGGPAIPIIQVDDKDGLGAFQLEDDDALFLRLFAARLAEVMDEPMSFRKVANVIKRADWERVRYKLLDLGLAEENADKSLSLNQTGREVITKLLPHSASQSRESGLSAGSAQHGTAQHTPRSPVGEGGPA